MPRWVKIDSPTVPAVQEHCGVRRRTTLDPQGHRDGLPVLMRNELSDAYVVAFEGMEMDTNSGETILTGEVIDQPHLHGILERINGLGLELLSVEALPNLGLLPGWGGYSRQRRPHYHLHSCHRPRQQHLARRPLGFRIARQHNPARAGRAAGGALHQELREPRYARQASSL
jgi:hypothetical protein